VRGKCREAGAGVTTISGASVLDFGAWYDIALTHDVAAGDLKLFVDAVLEVDALGTVGARQFSASSYYAVGLPAGSLITNCAVWDRVLTYAVPELDTLAHRWDTSESAMTVASGIVQDIEDLVGSSDLVDYTTGGVATTLNGQFAVESFLTRGNSGNTSSGFHVDTPDINQPWSFVGVFARRNTGLGAPFNGTGAPIDLRFNTSGTNPLVIIDTNLTVYYNATNTNTGAAPSFDTPCVLGFIANGASSEIWRDGVLAASVNMGSAAFTVASIMNTLDTAQGHDLYFLEAQVGPGVEPDMAGVSNALLDKWNTVATPSAPAVTINKATGQADPTGGATVTFDVVFSEPVTGFANADVTLSGTAGATTAVVTGSGTTYSVAVTGMTATGTVVATIGASVATGAFSGVGNAASTSTDNNVSWLLPPTGGTITTSGGYTYHTFTSSGTFNPQGLSPLAVDYGVIGAGGGGSPGTAGVRFGSGGAGGTVRTGSTTISASQSVTIGVGGAGTSTAGNNGTAGGSSSLGSISTATGGAGGLANNNVGAANADFGGGTTAAPHGSGAAGAGANGSTYTGGAGAAVFGTTYGGGGGGVQNGVSAGAGGSGGGTNGNLTVGSSSAAANTGGGAGGCGNGALSGTGGSGKVIVRYLTP
jgi:hypothetical protein